MLNRFRKVCFIVVATLVALASTGNRAFAEVLNDFVIQPGTFGGPNPVPAGGLTDIVNCPDGTVNGCIVADKIIGNYVEVFTVTGANSFSVDVLFDASTFESGDGTWLIPGSQSGLGNQYSIYALFSAGGTFGCDASGCSFSVDPTLGSALEVWEDDASPRDTTLTPPVNSSAPGTINVTRSGTAAQLANDTLLATSTIYSGQGFQPAPPCTISAGKTCGAFTVVFNPFQLTTAGGSFFVSPDPFYITLDLSGQFNSFDVTGTQTVNGSADAIFQGEIVPEPATLSLLGLGLLGLARRRSRKQ